jgi:mRNA-degrading endonuclease RelE of RelBE toxin-antitoxin system
VSYQIEVPASVKKEIRSLPGYVRAEARVLIRELASELRPTRSKELRAQPNIYRLWLAGRWRIAYHIDGEAQVIVVLRVERKESIDYEGLEFMG